jgi:hypothetical protein
MTKRQMKAIDKKIEAIFYAKCQRVQIPIMRMSEIYAAGRQAAIDGGDIEQAVLAATLAIAVNQS